MSSIVKPPMKSLLCVASARKAMSDRVASVGRCRRKFSNGTPAQQLLPKGELTIRDQRTVEEGDGHTHQTQCVFTILLCRTLCRHADVLTRSFMEELPPHADRKSVWLDCDPGTPYDHRHLSLAFHISALSVCSDYHGPAAGHDDALAIILAGGNLFPLAMPEHHVSRAFPELKMQQCSLYNIAALSTQKTNQTNLKALWPAGYDNRLRLLGVSTVAGNQTVEKVTLNALGLLTAAGLHSIRESSSRHLQPHF